LKLNYLESLLLIPKQSKSSFERWQVPRPTYQDALDTLTREISAARQLCAFSLLWQTATLLKSGLGAYVMRLNKFVWAGAILSLIWAIGAAIYSYKDDVKHAQVMADWSYRVCVYSPARPSTTDLTKCQNEREKSVRLNMEGAEGNAAVAALAPIPLAWLAVFCLIQIWRIQIAGFKAVVPWQSASPLKRSFIVLCCFSTGAAVVLAALITMNNYTATLVPVSPPSAMVSSVGNNSYVQARGTWTRTDLVGDAIANPLQTSTILCVRGNDKCTEAKGYIGGNVLFSDIITYDVQSWTNDAIVLKDEQMCAITLYTIDLNTKKVTGAGRKANTETEFCKTGAQMSPFTSGADSWSLSLVDGFPVYWQLLQKARPWPLRVIQTILGN
jgi:hypothetical protein